MKTKNKNTIWKGPNGGWVFQNLLDRITYHPTQERAQRAKNIWRPKLRQMIEDNIIPSGSKVHGNLQDTTYVIELVGTTSNKKGVQIKFHGCTNGRAAHLKGKEYDSVLAFTKEVFESQQPLPGKSAKVRFPGTDDDRRYGDLRMEYHSQLLEECQKQNKSHSSEPVRAPTVDDVEELLSGADGQSRPVRVVEPIPPGASTTRLGPEIGEQVAALQTVVDNFTCPNWPDSKKRDLLYTLVAVWCESHKNQKRLDKLRKI